MRADVQTRARRGVAADSRVLALCVVTSVALHLVLLHEDTVPARQTPVSSTTTTVLRSARPLQATASAVPAIRPTSTPVRRAPTLTETRAAPSIPPLGIVAPDTLPPTDAGPAHRRLTGDTTAADPFDAPSEADYLPRDQLTRGAVPQQSIDLVYPEFAPSGQFRAVLTLFIDDQGVVRRVRIDEADETGLPPVLEDTARQTFLRSPFLPGEIDGRPIRSRLRVEVAFTADPPRDHGQTAAR